MVPSRVKGLAWAFVLFTFVLKGLSAPPPPPKNYSPMKNKPIQKSGGKLVLFVMDGLSYRHLLPCGLGSFGEIGDWLERNGSMALLNTMGYGGADRFRAAMTLACGVRAFGDMNAALVLQGDESADADTALNAYRRRVGNPSPSPAPEPFKLLVFPMLTELKWRNERMQKKPIPFGLVPQSLKPKGILTVAIGCGDICNTSPYPILSKFRHALLIALDENGLGAGLTAPEKLLCKDPLMPFGIAVDRIKWGEAVGNAWEIADLLVLYPGETLRADLYGSERLIPAVIRRELSLLRPVVERLNLKRDLLLVFSLAPSRRHRGELSFICAAGKGIKSGGTLTSATTHQLGVISILDIPATVLHFFSAKPISPINGSPIRSASSKTELHRYLFGVGEAAKITDGWLRVAVLATWCVLQAFIFAALAAILLVGQKIQASNRWQISVALLAWLPVLVHLISDGVNEVMSSFLFVGIGQIVLGAILASIAVSLSWWLPVTSTLGAVLFSSFFFILDAVGNGLFSVNTPFGYSLFFGGRYYGIGNVGMGLTLGALYAVAIAARWRQWITAGLCFAGSVLIGTPFFGADIGGALTGTIIALTAIFTGRFRWWQFFVATFVFVLLLGVFSVFELMHPEPLTHWGRLIHSVSEGGLSPFTSIVWTKLGISIRAFRAIHWDVAFFAQIFLIAVLWWRRGKDWMLTALLAGIIAALLLNDSGPQTPVAFAFLPLCLLSQKSLANLRDLPTREPLG